MESVSQKCLTPYILHIPFIDDIQITFHQQFILKPLIASPLY